MIDHLSLIGIIACLDITFEVNKLADVTGYANDDAIAMINDAALLISARKTKW